MDTTRPLADGSSSVEAETRLIQDFFNALNAQDDAALLATLHPSIEYRFYIHGFEPVIGHQAMVEALHTIHAIFPDFHEELLTLRIAEGLGAAGWRISGSLAGPFPLPEGFAVPDQPQPTVLVEGVDVFEIQDGLIARKDTYADPTPWYQAYAPLLEHA